MVDFTSLSKKILMVACLLFVFGCNDNNSGNGGGNTTSDTLAATVQAINTSNQAVNQALNFPSNLHLVAFTPFTIACVGGGNADISGDVTTGIDSFPFNISVNFNACGPTGLEGILALSGDTMMGENFVYALSGSIDSENCTLTFQDFVVDFNFTSPGTSVLSGKVAADCNTGAVDCNFDNVDLADTNSQIASCS